MQDYISKESLEAQDDILVFHTESSVVKRLPPITQREGACPFKIIHLRDIAFMIAVMYESRCTLVVVDGVLAGFVIIHIQPRAC
jgi:hypothetical protein